MKREREREIEKNVQSCLAFMILANSILADSNSNLSEFESGALWALEFNNLISFSKALRIQRERYKQDNKLVYLEKY